MQADHTKRLTRIDGRLDRVEHRLGNVETELGTVKIGVHAILDLLNTHFVREQEQEQESLSGGGLT